jgi:hypothetical protein
MQEKQNFLVDIVAIKWGVINLRMISILCVNGSENALLTDLHIAYLTHIMKRGFQILTCFQISVIA